MRPVRPAAVRGRPPGRFAAAVGASLLATTLLASCSSESGPKTVNLYLAPEENLQTVVDRCNEEADGAYEIVYNRLPRLADGQREQMARRLAAEDSGMDILGLDVTWTAEFAEAGWIEEWEGERAEEASRGVLPGPLETAKWNDTLYGATKNTNVQLLWYDDRVVPEPPGTWAEMIDMAQSLKEEGKPHEILFTGAQYEGLVVVFNTLVASAGGQLLSEDGSEAVVDDGVVKALELLKKVTTSGVTDPSLTNQQEDQIRLAFQGGGGAFELNWPFVYASYAAEKPPEDLEHFKWARYPAVEGGESNVTIGGFNLAISEYSQNKPEAFDAALCLRNAESQKFQALKDGIPPSLESVYSDTEPLDPDEPADPENNPSMSTEYPMKDDILAALKDPAVRPLTPAYQNLSTIIANELSPPSAIDPQATADRLREQLNQSLQSKGVLP